MAAAMDRMPLSFRQWRDGYALAWEKGLPAPRWYEYNNTDLQTEDFNRKVLLSSAN
jgi:hypothetical protein